MHRVSVHLSCFTQEYSCHTNEAYINVSVGNNAFVFVSLSVMLSGTQTQLELARKVGKFNMILESGRPVCRMLT